MRGMKWRLWLMASVLVPWGLARAQAPARHGHLMIEPGLAETVEGARLVVGSPKPNEENPLLVMDTPVEGGSTPPWFNIILDPHEKFYKAWYGRDGCCYGTSHNGLLWNKPLLEFERDPNGGKTSLLIKNFRSAGFLRDEADDARLFKLIGQGKDGAEVRFSDDGIRFDRTSPVKNMAISPRARASVMRSLDGKGYVAFFAREPGAGKKGPREWVRSSSSDFVSWSDAAPLAAPGVRDPASFAVISHWGIYLAFTGIQGGESDSSGLSLAVSRDGQSWTAHGASGLPDPVQSVIPLRDEVRIFHTHGAQLHLVSLRADGFAGYRPAGAKAGTIVTKPIACPGMKLRLSADVDEGWFGRGRGPRCCRKEQRGKGGFVEKRDQRSNEPCVTGCGLIGSLQIHPPGGDALRAELRRSSVSVRLA